MIIKSLLWFRVGSQFFITLGEDTTCSLDEHIVFGEIAEGHDVLLKLNETICDITHRPYQDIRFELFLFFMFTLIIITFIEVSKRLVYEKVDDIKY